MNPRPSPQRGLGHAERSGGVARGGAAGSHVWHWDVAHRSAHALPCAGTLGEADFMLFFDV